MPNSSRPDRTSSRSPPTSRDAERAEDRAGNAAEHGEAGDAPVEVPGAQEPSRAGEPGGHHCR